jgi:hypothetical protein
MAQFGQRFAQQFQQGFAAEGSPYGTVSQLINSGRQGASLSTALGDVVPGSQRVVQTGQHWWVNHPEDEPLPGCNIPSHYAVQCEALDGTPLPAPLCKLLRVPQGTKWGREMSQPIMAPMAPMVIQPREETC